MKSFVLTAGFALIASTTTLFAADDSATAMEIAQRHNACGEGNAIVSARFLENGQVGVRCAAGAAASASCVPFATAASTSESELRALQIAQRQNACDDSDIVSARFANGNEVRVTCSSAGGATIAQCPAGTVLSGTATASAAAAGGAVATNFVPVAAGLFAVVLGAAAVGGGSSTSDTQ